MSIRTALSIVLLATLTACSSSTDEGDGPVIDTLTVPSTTSEMTAAGVTGQGVLVTVTAHDDDAGISALHVVFTENQLDQAIDIPTAPTTLNAQQFALILQAAPKGAHPVELRLVDAKGRSSAVVKQTITVP